jgi:DNA invertase Pin-like site-specific DNA recombinase
MNVNRRGFQSLVNDWVKNPDSPEFTHIIMRDPTRIARSMKLVIEFDELAKQHGIEVLYVR